MSYGNAQRLRDAEAALAGNAEDLLALKGAALTLAQDGMAAQGPAGAPELAASLAYLQRALALAPAHPEIAMLAAGAGDPIPAAVRALPHRIFVP